GAAFNVLHRGTRNHGRRRAVDPRRRHRHDELRPARATGIPLAGRLGRSRPEAFRRLRRIGGRDGGPPAVAGNLRDRRGVQALMKVLAVLVALAAAGCAGPAPVVLIPDLSPSFAHMGGTRICLVGADWALEAEGL